MINFLSVHAASFTTAAPVPPHRPRASACRRSWSLMASTSTIGDNAYNAAASHPSRSVFANSRSTVSRVDFSKS